MGPRIRHLLGYLQIWWGLKGKVLNWLSALPQGVAMPPAYDNLLLAAQLAGAVSTLVVLLYSTYRYVLSPIYGFTRRHLIRLIKLFQRLDSVASIVEKELTPNGGGSLHDTISRIGAHQLLTDARVRALTHASATPTWESNHLGECVFSSRALCHLLGRSSDEMLGMGWINSVAPDHRDRVADSWADAVAQRREFNETYDVIVNGIRMGVSVAGFMMFKSDGTVLGYVGTVTPD